MTDIKAPKADFTLDAPEARIYVGDCRELLPRLPEVQARALDLVFADPPFNWKRDYDDYKDDLSSDEYLKFTYDWLDLCADGLSKHGALWVNIPDDWAAEIVVHLKKRGLHMINWCVWHYRFGQNAKTKFISSKVHALYFARTRAIRVKAGDPHAPLRLKKEDQEGRTWNVMEILEPSDRATTYFDPRTQNKRDGMPAGMRTPMDVWYGQYWGRIQGNNSERRGYHDNQLPEVYLERVVRACSDESGLVLDPFLGSGTTGVIAHALKRRFIGCEFSKQNAKSAFERIKHGPLRLGAAINQSTAIFAPRSRGPASKQGRGRKHAPTTASTSTASS